MRYRNRPDLVLMASESEEGGAAAGVFTRNRFCAAPVEICRERLGKGSIRAVVVNAGIANACTGAEGLELARGMTRTVASQLGVREEAVLVASTGIIGQQVRLEPVEKAMPGLVASLRPDGWEDAARGIMTTDTVPKMSWTRVEIDGRTVTVGGIAKGAGMIAPDMATLLAFVCTDARVEPRVLQHWLKQGADQSFNAITIDGDTSTNDTLLALASGAAANSILSEAETADSRRFGRALSEVLLDLAIQIVVDGEGATKLIHIRVTGAPDPLSARQVALTIANSPLVKTAFFGGDANWGRIVAAAGRSGVELLPERVALYFDDLCVFQGGTPVQGAGVEEEATQVFSRKEIHVTMDLGMGPAEFSAHTCDFSYDYVKINADYRT
ncbi:MAG: bifunctional glutamate N-acetyltransferase/amino-acid acetyltransferase ArgJ [Syntrophobacteraceae bacterium]|jgi:glutamate N-acetyltransferase/amino-acid N-acetyltransferase|nr:bifunctional glutamate N-acetyltransferase/amino-acid acetyltransferase ArgJ [Syntrophobacteraceae bacterium]